jgi:hypothetical protein
MNSGFRKSLVVAVMGGIASIGAFAGPAEKVGAPATRPSARPAGNLIQAALAPAKKPVRVLFIGNSYTFFNGGLGSIVQAMASAMPGGRKFEFAEVTRGGQTLEGHWAEGKALAAIRKGGWDFVVLQEHSLRPVQDRETMWRYARMFDAEIRKTGAKTVFYETWARKNKPEMQAILNQAYAGIAKEVKAVVAPAGPAWERVLKAKPGLALHIPDLSHPTPAGSYLNACVFYSTFFGEAPQAGLPRVIKDAAGKVLFELSESEAALLQRAAFETCGQGAVAGGGKKTAE